mmetsp:Transcript_26634/g.58382  ORF Transcript_26634/g.58382 Transcript_26634/m.58382 type:complete len:567 (+) Transcript_26634:272-1972(+)
MDAQEELADLQNRFQLLEGDRKAFYEQSQLTLKQNKEACDAVRRENKQLRAALAAIHKEHGSSVQNAGLGEAEIAKVEAQLTQLRQRHNQLAHSNRAKEVALARQEDELRDIQKSAKPPDASSNPQLRQIRTLENRLDKAMIKFNEAQAIRKTYDQIVKRLKDERVNFDNQLGAIESTLRAKERDFDELLLMSTDAAHACEAAKAELAKLSALVEEERKARSHELHERRNAVKARQEMNERMEDRERARRDIVLQAQGDLSESDEKRLKQKVVATNLQSHLKSRETDHEKQVVSEYEAAFRKIKESTGVSDVNEVIQKVLTQEQTHANLVKSTKDAQSRIEALVEERCRAKANLEDLKFSGGSGNGSRQEVEAWEKKVAESQAALERAKARSARLTKVFIDVRVGVEHLSSKLEPVRLDSAPVVVNDETVAEAMAECDAKLNKLAAAVATLPQPEEADRPLSPNVAGAEPGLLDSSSGFNVRVSVRDHEEDEEETDESDDGAASPDVPDREMMKKMHGMMLEKANSKGKKKRKKFGAERGANGDADASPSRMHAAGSRSVGRRDLE